MVRVVRIRAERDDHRDREAVRAVHLAAFGPVHGRTVGGLVDALRAAVTPDQRLSLVAEEEAAITGRAVGTVVGHVLSTPARLDAPRRLVDVHVLSPLAVHPDRHGQGVGTALVERGLTELAERGVPVVFLEGAPGYYARFGFRTASTLGFRSPSLRIPDVAFQALTLPAYEEWMTGTLVYPPQFWDHDAVGLR